MNPLCKCGHHEVEHRIVTSGALVMIVGVCLVPGCKCPEFREAPQPDYADRTDPALAPLMELAAGTPYQNPLREYRQSLLRGFTTCARRTKRGLEVGDDLAIGWVEHAGDLGTAFHEFMHRYLATLGEQGFEQMPTQEAIEVMYEVLAELDIPPLPGEAMGDLKDMVLSFCDVKWVPRMLAGAVFEEPLRAEIACPDGEVRVLKGTPDALMFDPPDALLIIDAKSGRGRAKGPRVEPERGAVVEDRKYLTDQFQGDIYSLLALRRYPSAARVKFRQFHVRSGQIRQGTLDREGLEHVERKVATLMMLLDRAIREGDESSLWRPRSGTHCVRQCPVARSCPIPAEMRGDGALETLDDADTAARVAAVLEGQRTALLGQLKAWVEDPTNPLPAANEDQVYRWEPPTGKGRRFGLWPRVSDQEGGGEA